MIATPTLDLRSVTIVQNIRMGSSGRWITWNRDFDFVPGQIIAVTTDRSLPPRWYSLGSGANQHRAGILFTLVDDGELTPVLSTLVPGDFLWISEPRGGFIDRGGPSVWIATGAGIAPFLSMLRSGQVVNRFLVYGSKTLDDLYFHQELSDLLKGSYVACCSRQSGFFEGRVTDYLASRTWPSQHHYFLCGSAQMIVEARDLLIAGQVSYSQIVSEVYF